MSRPRTITLALLMSLPCLLDVGGAGAAVGARFDAAGGPGPQHFHATPSSLVLDEAGGFHGADTADEASEGCFVEAEQLLDHPAPADCTTLTVDGSEGALPSNIGKAPRD